MSFELTSSTSYTPSTGISLLARHLRRLRTAHAALQRELPDCWCASQRLPTDGEITKVIETAIDAAGRDQDLRVRILVHPDGNSTATTFPLKPMPPYPVHLVLDSEVTYYTDPLTRYKTTVRAVYDKARDRVGANLHPSKSDSDPPFDVLMFNEREELTETSIANVAFRFSNTQEHWITPAANCGLLEGVMRAELLEQARIREGIVKIDKVKEAARNGTLQIMCFNGVRGVYYARLRVL